MGFHQIGLMVKAKGLQTNCRDEAHGNSLISPGKQCPCQAAAVEASDPGLPSSTELYSRNHI
jgi:hypothetical protein